MSDHVVVHPRTAVSPGLRAGVGPSGWMWRLEEKRVALVRRRIFEDGCDHDASTVGDARSGQGATTSASFGRQSGVRVRWSRERSASVSLSLLVEAR